MDTAYDSPYPVRVVKRDDGYYVVCSATVLVPENADLSEVHKNVLAEATRQSHIAAAVLEREGELQVA